MSTVDEQNSESRKANPEIKPLPPPPPIIVPIPEFVPEPGRNRPEVVPRPEIFPITEPKTEPGKEYYSD